MATKPINIEKIIEQAVTKAVRASAILGVEKGKSETNNLFKQTEIRLYAYPDLRDNIEKYNQDIEDLRREALPGRSKDIVFFGSFSGGTRLSPDEIQEARILLLQRKIYRDQTEIDEIEFALQSIKDDGYRQIIELRYFANKSDDEVAAVIKCDPSTVRRNKGRLVRKIAVKLYGAEAVGQCTFAVPKRCT